MSQTLTITTSHSDPEFCGSAPIMPVTRVAFEREFGVAFSSISENPLETYVLWLAWHASVRGRANPIEFDAWLEGVVSVEANIDDGEDDSDPLGRSPSRGGSLQPPSSPGQG